MRRITVLIPALVLTVALSGEAQAYIGPGAGVSLLGSLFGILAMLGLGLWAMLRWAVHAAVPARLRGRQEPVASAVGTSASGSAESGVARARSPLRGVTVRLVYLCIGVLIAAVFSFPRDMTHSFMLASVYLIRGFSDPVVKWHTDPARFPADDAGVVTHQPDLAFAGTNLELSSTALEARLLDMDGRLLHRWHLESDAIGRAWAAEGQPVANLAGFYWRRARALPDGSLLVVVEAPTSTPYAFGMMKLDWESNVVWMRPARYHHALDVGPDGRIYTLYQELEEERLAAISWVDPPFLNEGVAVLAPDGSEIERINIVDAFLETPFESYLRRVPTDLRGDVLHLNSVHVVTEEEARRSSIAEAGQLVVSVREISTVAVIDLSTEKVVWAESDLWVEQHEPVLTTGAGVLIFDNLGAGGGTRAIEWDTSRKTVLWSWEGTTAAPLASELAGSVSLLPNGNRLVTESYGGRAIEVTEDGEIAWEWRSDRRFGDNLDRVGHLMEVVRLPKGFFAAHRLRTTEGPPDVRLATRAAK